MSESTLIASGGKLTRDEVILVATPPGTATHKPVPHGEVIGALIETLGFRHIAVVRDEYAVSKDGMKMFGVLDLDTGIEGCRFSIGLRNSHDKSMRLGLTVGYRVFVCENMAFSGDFEPVLAKHSKNFSLLNALSIGVDKMQRNFEPMRSQVHAWQSTQLADVSVKMIIYRAFIESDLEVPRGIWRGPCTTTTSIRSTKSSRRARCGAYRMRSRRRSSSSTRSRNSKPRPSSLVSWRPRGCKCRRCQPFYNSVHERLGRVFLPRGVRRSPAEPITRSFY